MKLIKNKLNTEKNKLTHLQELKSAIGDSVQMRWSFVSSFVTVEISHDLSVDHQPFVRIDTDTE